jgi:hypothetical protein
MQVTDEVVNGVLGVMMHPLQQASPGNEDNEALRGFKERNRPERGVSGIGSHRRDAMPNRQPRQSASSDKTVVESTRYRERIKKSFATLSPFTMISISCRPAWWTRVVKS